MGVNNSPADHVQPDGGAGAGADAPRRHHAGLRRWRDRRSPSTPARPTRGPAPSQAASSRSQQPRHHPRHMARRQSALHLQHPEHRASAPAPTRSTCRLISGSYVAGQTWLSPNVAYDAIDTGSQQLRQCADDCQRDRHAIELDGRRQRHTARSPRSREDANRGMYRRQHRLVRRPRHDRCRNGNCTWPRQTPAPTPSPRPPARPASPDTAELDELKHGVHRNDPGSGSTNVT